MKVFKLFVVLFTVLFSYQSLLAKRTLSELPNSKVKNYRGNDVSLSSINNDGKPILIFTWSKNWCNPCVMRLNEMAEYYKKWQKETGVKIIALNLDKKESYNDVKQFANEKGWTFDIYQDAYGEFIDDTKITSAPLSVFLNKNLKIVKQYLTYSVTPQQFYGILINIDKTKQYFDSEWQLTSKNNAKFYREITMDYSNYEIPYKVKDYYINGTLQMEGAYKELYPEEIEHGEFSYYDENGNIQRKAEYISGEIKRRKYYFPNGQLQIQLTYKDWVPWTIEKSFDKNGAPKNCGTLKDGTGTYFIFSYETGDTTAVYEYKNGRYDGTIIKYYDNGKYIRKDYYKNGISYKYNLYNNENKSWFDEVAKELKKIDINQFVQQSTLEKVIDDYTEKVIFIMKEASNSFFKDIENKNAWLGNNYDDDKKEKLLSAYATQLIYYEIYRKHLISIVNYVLIESGEHKNVDKEKAMQLAKYGKTWFLDKPIDKDYNLEDFNDYLDYYLENEYDIDNYDAIYYATMVEILKDPPSNFLHYYAKYNADWGMLEY